MNPEQAYAELNSISSILGDDRHMLDTWPGFPVKAELIKNLDTIVAAVRDEVARAVDTRFGTDMSKWIEVPVDTLLVVVAQATAQYTVGTDLCTYKKTIGTLCISTNAILHHQAEVKNISSTSYT